MRRSVRTLPMTLHRVRGLNVQMFPNRRDEEYGNLENNADTVASASELLCDESFVDTFLFEDHAMMGIIADWVLTFRDGRVFELISSERAQREAESDDDAEKENGR